MKKRINILLAMLLSIQMCVCIYAGIHKTGWFVDEIFTFSLSNSETAFLSLEEGFLESWVEGEDIFNSLSVQYDDRFDYSTVKINQEKDVHPPFYYYLIHTVFSLFPNKLSKWFGIVPNIAFCLLTTILIYHISKKLKFKDIEAILISAAYALSVGAVTTATFIRMYAMLTFLCTLFVAVHMNVIESKTIHVKQCMCLFLLTVLGILTQYYFLIFCFFLCGLFSGYLLLSKKYKDLIKYVVTELGALITSFFIFPKMYFHIFKGYRGAEAISNAGVFDNFLVNLEQVLNIISNNLFNGYLFWIVFLIFIGTFIVLSRNKFKIIPLNNYSTVILLFSALLISFGYIIVLSKIAPYQTDRYYMCIYPLIIIAILGLFIIILKSLCSDLDFTKLFLTIFICFMVVNGYSNTGVGYLYEWYEYRYDALENYYEYPCIVLNGANWDNSADEWAIEYCNYPAVFRCNKDGSFDGLEIAKNTKDLSNGFVLYLNYLFCSEEELINKLSQYFIIENYNVVFDMMDCKVYYINPLIT